MYSVTRNRETIYGNYILHYHPDYAGKVPFYYTPDEPYTLEGGDILNPQRRHDRRRHLPAHHAGGRRAAGL